MSVNLASSPNSSAGAYYSPPQWHSEHPNTSENSLGSNCKTACVDERPPRQMSLRQQQPVVELRFYLIRLRQLQTPLFLFSKRFIDLIPPGQVQADSQAIYRK